MLDTRLARSYIESANGWRDCPPRASPLWARRYDELDQRYTLGIEEEVMLLEPERWSLAQSSDQVLPRLPDDLSLHTSAETHAAVVELATGIHPDVEGVAGELASLRNRLVPELRAMGLSVAAAGTHPLTVWDETEVSGAVRYQLLGRSQSRTGPIVNAPTQPATGVWSIWSQAWRSSSSHRTGPPRPKHEARENAPHPTERSGPCAAGSHTPVPQSS